MKSALFAVIVLCSLVCPRTHANAAEPLVYDPDRGAIAVDPYFDGFGGTIELDFNSDHSWAAVIMQSLWHYKYGSTTEVGLYHTTTETYPSGGTSELTVYGWGTRIGTLAAVLDYSSFVATLYSGEPAADMFHFFADEWNVADGKTAIFVEPASGSPVSGLQVQWSDLGSVYFRTDPGEWKKYSDVYEVEQPALPAAVNVDPDTLNLKSKGKWITVYITPPQGYAAADIDLATVGLSLETIKTFNGLPEERLLYRAGPSEVILDGSGTQLMVKFDRSTVTGLLSAGEATLEIFGVLPDNRTFRGSDTIRVH